MSIENASDAAKLFENVKFFLANDNNEKIKQILKEGGAGREFYVSELVTHVFADNTNFNEYKQAIDCQVPVVTSEWVTMCLKCDSTLPYQPFELSDKLFSDVTFCFSQIPEEDRSSLWAMGLYYGAECHLKLTSKVTHLVATRKSGPKVTCALKHKQIKIVSPTWIVDSISASKCLPEVEFEPYAIGEQPTSKAANVHPSETDVEMNEALPSAGMVADIGDVGDKENNALSTPNAVATDLLKGFVLVFSDYEERMPVDTFNIWKTVIEQAGGVIKSVYSADITHVICLHQQSNVFKKGLLDGKKIATAYWLNDVMVVKKVTPPNTPLHIPVPFTDLVAGMKNSLITVSGYQGKERVLIKHMINFLGAEYTGHMSRNHTHLITKSEDSDKHRKALEWSISCISPKWLSDMMQSGQAFPCILKSKYSVLGQSDELRLNPIFSAEIMEAWEEAEDQDTSSAGTKRKFSEISDEKSAPSIKRRRVDLLTHTVPKVLFTGLTGANVHRLKQNVLKLKGELAKTVQTCTHLVAPKITRTVKFLSAVSICKYLVAPAWVDASFEAKTFVDESEYTLNDPDSEEFFGFKLKRSLLRAQTRRVCEGLNFIVTPSILPAPNAMKEIIECAGGKMFEVKTHEEITNDFVEKQEKENSNCYLVSCMDDKTMWAPFVKDGYDVYNVELILSGVMKQDLEWNLHHL